eukprot:5390268-Prymnesium_polylepis.1
MERLLYTSYDTTIVDTSDTAIQYIGYTVPGVHDRSCSELARSPRPPLSPCAAHVARRPVRACGATLVRVSTAGCWAGWCADAAGT